MGRVAVNVLIALAAVIVSLLLFGAVKHREFTIRRDRLAADIRLLQAIDKADDPDRYYLGYANIYSDYGADHSHVVLVGDSTARGFELQDQIGNKALNRAIQGEPTAELIKRIPELKRHTPETLIILSGANDIRRGVPTSEIVRNIRQVATARIAPLVLVLGVLPARDDILNPRAVKALNESLARECASWGAVYVAPPAKYTVKADTDNGFHPNEAGFNLVTAAIRKVPGSLLSFPLDYSN